MSHLQLRFCVHRDRADELSGMLEELGALAVSWEDAGEDAHFDVAGPGEPAWRRVNVTGLFESSCTPELVAWQVNSRLQENLAPRVTELADRDWERASLERFRPRKYRGNLWVCPSWAVPPDPLAPRIVIDPGLAFGTGEHTTTALCLDWISERDWSGRTVLDYGCGSGILAIACLRQGAAFAVGTDIDPRALAASTANAERSGVAERYLALTPGDLRPELEADLVVANILAGALVSLSEVLAHHTRQGGFLLLSGVLENQAPRVQRRFCPAFHFDTELRDEWCLLIGRKR